MISDFVFHLAPLMPSDTPAGFKIKRCPASRLFKMAGKRRAIFISGCDSGFGYSLALHCQRHMDLEVIAGCYQPSSDQSGAKTLAQEGVEIVALDVTKDDSIADALIKTQTILEEKDLELWSVVNNAAVLVFAEAEWQTRDMVRHQFDVNVVGALELTKAFLPLLRRSQGRVVNMVSFCTDCPLPTLSVYTATKVSFSVIIKPNDIITCLLYTRRPL